GEKPQAALAELLKDPNEQARRFAAVALLRLDPGHEGARSGLKELVPKVVEFLDGARLRSGVPEYVSRPYFIEVLEALGGLGKEAKGAAPLLRRLAEKDPEPSVRKAARQALAKIQPAEKG